MSEQLANYISWKAEGMETKTMPGRPGSSPLTPTACHSAVVGMLLAGIAVLCAVAPAVAQTFPAATQATLLVGGDPLVNANCPLGSPGAAATGSSANATATANGGAGCGPAPTANTSGTYTVVGVTSPSLSFLAACQSSNGDNGGTTSVPAGTNVAGLGVVAVVTPITGNNVAVTFPNGATAIVNQVTNTPGVSITRRAVAFSNGTIVGRVICGLSGVYPLAVDISSGSAAAPALAGDAASGGTSGHLSDTTLMIAGGFGLAVLAQVALGRRVRRRRRDDTTA